MFTDLPADLIRTVAEKHLDIPEIMILSSLTPLSWIALKGQSSQALWSRILVRDFCSPDKLREYGIEVSAEQFIIDNLMALQTSNIQEYVLQVYREIIKMKNNTRTSGKKYTSYRDKQIQRRKEMFERYGRKYDGTE